MSSTLVNSARLQASLLKKYPAVPKNLLFNRSIPSNSNVLSPLQTCYFRSYHTSPLSLAKDPKKDIPNFSNKKMDNKPSQNKPTQPPQQKPPQQKNSTTTTTKGCNWQTFSNWTKASYWSCSNYSTRRKYAQNSY